MRGVKRERMKKKLASIVLVAMLVSVELLLLVGNALANVETSTKTAVCIEVHSSNNTPNNIISLSSSSVTSYVRVMKFDNVKRKLIDAKNKGIVGNERHFFDKRALERSITPGDIGEVVDTGEILEEQLQNVHPKLRYKIRGITSSGRELILIVAVTKEGYLYVKTGWGV